MADKEIRIVHRWPDGRELTPQELDDRRQALAQATIRGWARSKGYTVAYERQKAAGE